MIYIPPPCFLTRSLTFIPAGSHPPNTVHLSFASSAHKEGSCKQSNLILYPRPPLSSLHQVLTDVQLERSWAQSRGDVVAAAFDVLCNVMHARVSLLLLLHERSGTPQWKREGEDVLVSKGREARRAAAAALSRCKAVLVQGDIWQRMAGVAESVEGGGGIRFKEAFKRRINGLLKEEADAQRELLCLDPHAAVKSSSMTAHLIFFSMVGPAAAAPPTTGGTGSNFAVPSVELPLDEEFDEEGLPSDGKQATPAAVVEVDSDDSHDSDDFVVRPKRNIKKQPGRIQSASTGRDPVARAPLRDDGHEQGRGGGGGGRVAGGRGRGRGK